MRLPAVEVHNLYFRYDKEYVLEDITATIWDQEYIAIIGPNGGGKSTFVRLLLGLLQPTQGEIFLYNKPPLQARHLVGYLPQNVNFHLEIPLLAREVILQGRLGPKKFRFNAMDYKLLAQVAKELEIDTLLDKKIANLSGGERQRVLLARALITKPKLLILDEPTAAVDINAQKRIYEILKTLKMTKIVISHDINILLEGVDRVFYLNRKLFIHDNIPLKLQNNKGHFCEMELFEELKRRCDG